MTEASAAETLRLGDVEVELCSVEEAESLVKAPHSLVEWLGPKERVAFGRLRTLKRRRDWLAARVAAKRLICRRLEQAGRKRPACDIQIASAETREPFVALPDGRPDPELPISLTHSSGWGACALGPPGSRVGIDLERIEPRDPAWRELMADASDIGPELAGDPEGLTRLWAAKEAILKLLGLGLSVDARAIRPAGETVELTGRARARWVECGSKPIALSYVRRNDLCLTVAAERQED